MGPGNPQSQTGNSQYWVLTSLLSTDAWLVQPVHHCVIYTDYRDICQMCLRHFGHCNQPFCLLTCIEFSMYTKCCVLCVFYIFWSTFQQRSKTQGKHKTYCKMSIWCIFIWICVLLWFIWYFGWRADPHSGVRLVIIRDCKFNSQSGSAAPWP